MWFTPEFCFTFEAESKSTLWKEAVMRSAQRFRGPIILLTCAAVALGMGLLTNAKSIRQLSAREMETIVGAACPGCTLSKPSNACNQPNYPTFCVTGTGTNLTCPATWKWYPGIQTYVCQEAENQQICQTGTLVGCWIGHTYTPGTVQLTKICSDSNPPTCENQNGYFCRLCTDGGTNGISQNQENDTCIPCSK